MKRNCQKIHKSQFFIISLFIHFIQAQDYTFLFNENIVLKHYLIGQFWKKTQITHDFQIKECINRQLLLCTTIIDFQHLNRPNGYKINQMLDQSSITYSVNDEDSVEFQVAEICINGVFVHKEDIIVNPAEFKESFIYKSKPPKYKQNMKSIPFIIGFLQKSEQVLSLFIEEYQATNDGFEFRFSSTCQYCITQININYLYYEENFSTYFQFNDIKESKYKLMDPPLMLDQNIRPPVIMNLPFECNFDDILKCGISIGFDGYYFKKIQGWLYSIKASMANQKQGKQLSIKYTTWHQGQVSGITTKIIFFFMVKCNTLSDQIGSINHKEQCIKICPDGYYQDFDSERLINICKICKLPCKTCSNVNDCLSCGNKQYLYNKKCLDNKPERSFCTKRQIF